MGKRLLPKIIKRSRELIHWGETKEGCQIYREPNEVGGHRYWSDEIGGGVIIWDTALVSPVTLLKALEMEGWIMSPEGKASVEAYRAELVRTVDAEPGDGEIPFTLSLSDAMASISTDLLHKEIAARETEEPLSESSLKFPIEDYQRLLSHIQEDGAVDGQFFGMELYESNTAGELSERPEAMLAVSIICDALKHAAGERLAEAQIKHMRRIAAQATAEIDEAIAELRVMERTNQVTPLVNAMKKVEGELMDVAEMFHHICDPIMGVGDGVITRYEREIYERQETEWKEACATHVKTIADLRDRLDKLQVANLDLEKQIAEMSETTEARSFCND